MKSSNSITVVNGQRVDNTPWTQKHRRQQDKQVFESFQQLFSKSRR